MYAIQYQRVTGETGIYQTRYRTYSEALGAVQALLSIDRIPHSYKYSIIEKKSDNQINTPNYESIQRI